MQSCILQQRRPAAVLATLTLLAVTPACDPDTPLPTGPRIRPIMEARATVVGASVTVLEMDQAWAINAAGQVVGSKFPTDSNLAVLWTPGGGLQDLGSLGGQYAGARGINDLGHVVGYSFLAGNAPSHAFLWAPGIGMQDLGTLGGYSSGASAINNADQVVGSSLAGPLGGPDALETRAFVWTPGHGMQSLGSLDAEFRQTYATDINNSGQVVGFAWSRTDSRITRAFLWTASDGMKPLGTLGGSFSRAMAINDAGQVVGESTTSSGAYRAFLWTPNAGMRDLGALGTGVNSAAFAINESGEVAGESDIGAGDTKHAFFWNTVDGMVDLFPFTQMTGVFGINNRGQVAGFNRVATLQFAVPNRAPVAIAGGPYTGQKKKPVVFDGTRSSDPDGDLLTYAWDFGDGSPLGGGATPVHEYGEWGTYAVTLRVSDPVGLFTTQTTTATIAPPGHLKQRP